MFDFSNDFHEYYIYDGDEDLDDNWSKQKGGKPGLCNLCISELSALHIIIQNLFFVRCFCTRHHVKKLRTYILV